MRKRFNNTTMSANEETHPMMNDANSEEESYTAIQIAKPGGYDKLKQVKIGGKGSTGANIETMKMPTCFDWIA